MSHHVAAETERIPGEAETRTWEELRSSGLLWLINRQVFHPRGFALAFVRQDNEIVGWRLLGDGGEVWAFGDDEDELFAAAQATLTPTTAEDRGWDPSENCWCGGPVSSTHPHQYGTGRHCRKEQG